MAVTKAVDRQSLPAREDPYLYVPRWANDAAAHGTTEEYVQANLANRSNTYYFARITVVVFCVGAFVVGVVAAWAVSRG